MGIKLYQLYIVYFILIFIQHIVVGKMVRVKDKRQRILLMIQLIIILYCTWIGTSKNPNYEMSGLVLLILSLALFWRRLHKDG
ncbi:MAG: hypothetical protein D6160_17530 [Ketobacter sp.]|nr:MAG: hypothetical protein D6160_17530 [Ketobacter sp.]